MRKIFLSMALVSLCLMFTVSVEARIDSSIIVGIWTFDKDGDASDIWIGS